MQLRLAARIPSTEILCCWRQARWTKKRSSCGLGHTRRHATAGEFRSDVWSLHWPAPRQIKRMMGGQDCAEFFQDSIVTHCDPMQQHNCVKERMLRMLPVGAIRLGHAISCLNFGVGFLAATRMSNFRWSSDFRSFLPHGRLPGFCRDVRL